MPKLTPFAIVLSAIFLSGCVNSMTQGSATEAEVCRQLGSKLPTRSRSDTQQSQDEDQQLYAAYALTCPEFEYLIPK